MKTQLSYASALLVAAASAVAIAAPASAAPTCVNLGTSGTHCESPGNGQIVDTPPIQIKPQLPYFGVPGLFPRGHHLR